MITIAPDNHITEEEVPAHLAALADINVALTWLRTLTKSPTVNWSTGQLDAAQEALTRASWASSALTHILVNQGPPG